MMFQQPAKWCGANSRQMDRTSIIQGLLNLYYLMVVEIFFLGGER
jgi:hypothetical protein